MTILIHAINDKIIQYPTTLDALRRDYPNVSFPVSPTAADLAPFDRHIVERTPPPAHDPRTERLEDQAKLTESGWKQRWAIRPATEQEIADYDIAHAPEPDWMNFGIELITHEVVGPWYNALPLGLANGLSIGLKDASNGDPRLFSGVWSRIEAPEATAAAIAELAVTHHLPPSFVAFLGGAAEQ